MNRISYFLVAFYSLTAIAQQESTDAALLETVMERATSYSRSDRQTKFLGDYTEMSYAQEAEFAQNQLDSLGLIHWDKLSENDQISLELLQFTLQERVDRFKHKTYLNPIQADQGFHLNLNYWIRPLRSKADAQNYLKMLWDIPRYTEEHLVLLRKALQEKRSQPKVIFEGYESTYEQHLVTNPEESEFFGPLKDLPEQIPAVIQDSLRQQALKAIETALIPSFKKIKSFFETEYIPSTRNSIGLSATPGGGAAYQNRINYYTTSNQYTAAAIHNIGLAEVARIRAQMEEIIAEVGFEGDFRAFLEMLRTSPQFYVTEGEDLLKEARNISKKIDAQLPGLFKTLPRQPYGVRKVPDALAPKYTGGRYSPSRRSDQPGYYLVNTYKLKSRPLYVLPALTLHEAVPGHHLQMALNQELSDSIPWFRRSLYLSAFGEGWGLYAEYLGDEMGIYTTPYEKFGQLTYEMWRACRLVVDTGIHAMGWNKQQVLDYMASNTALSLHEINTETDRYIAWPGQAISYKIGEIKIRELRKMAEKELGSDFDIREFHEVILEMGTVTLPILERRVKKFIANTKNNR